MERQMYSNYHALQKRANFPTEPYIVPNRNPSFEYPQSSSPVQANVEYLSSIIPSSVKKATVVEDDTSRSWILRTGIGTWPWWKKPHTGKHSAPIQSVSPVEYSDKDISRLYREYYSSTMPPIGCSVSLARTSDLSHLSTEFSGTSIRQLKAIIEKNKADQLRQ